MRSDALEDFEDRRDLSSVYDGWERIRSPGHPDYNEVTLERDRSGAASGDHYVLLRTLGGSTALRMRPTAFWKADPRRAYRFTARTRLSGTGTNAASVVLTWMNAAFRPLREDRTAPVTRAPAWTELALDVPRLPPEAAWVRVTLSFEGRDVRGDGAFDRLELSSRLRVVIAPAERGRALLIFDPGAAPRLAIDAPGLPEGEHSLEFALRNGAGEEILRSGRRPMTPGAPAAVDLPALRPGAYTIQAVISGSSGEVARASAPILVPNPWTAGHPSRPFGLTFNPFTEADRGVPDLMRLGGVRHARVVLHDRPSSGRSAPPSPEELLSMLRDVCSDEPATVMAILADEAPDPAEFRETVRRYREMVTHWQIGADDSPLAGRPGTDPALAAARGVLRELSRFAQAGVPSGGQPPRLANAQFYVGPAGAAGDPGRYASLGGPPQDTAALLRQLILLRSAAPAPDATFVPVAALVDGEGHPGPAFLALRAANDLLAGATPAGRLLEGPVTDRLFDRGGRSVLALWSEGPEVARDLFLGPEAVIYPPLGEARPARPGETLAVGPMPTFIMNLDTGVLRTLRSLEFRSASDARLRSNAVALRAEPTPLALRLLNAFPSDSLKDVRLRLVPPPGWTVRPRSAEIESLAPGAEFAPEFSFAPPAGETDGPREVAIEVSFTHGGRPTAARLPRTVVATPQVEISAEMAPLAGAPNSRKVALRLINRSGRPATLLARVRLPHLPERLEPLGTLDAGASRDFEYVVRDVHLIDPTLLRAEVSCEERGGDRLHFEKSFPIR